MNKLEMLFKAMKKELWALTAKAIVLMYALAILTAIVAVVAGIKDMWFSYIMVVVNVITVELSYTKPRRIVIVERYKPQLLEALKEMKDKT